MSQNEDRIYFNQNLIYHKDNLYNSGGTFEVNIANSTNDYKSFSPPILNISIIGDNNIRRVCSLSFTNAVDLFSSVKDIISNVESIYTTGRSNSIVKKYHFDKTLKLDFIQIQNTGDRVVTITIVLNSSDFSKVVIPYSVFSSFFIGILKYFVSDFVNIAFTFSSRNLLTELLEYNKQTTSLLKSLPSSLVEINGSKKLEDAPWSNQIKNLEAPTNGEETDNSNMLNTINDFDNFLGKDMENIKIAEFDNNKQIQEVKINNNELTSLLISKTLTNDLSVLESMLNASITRPDPMITIMEGFRRSMNLSEDFVFFPEIPINNLKSFLYISKIIHDYYLNAYLSKDVSIPSGFSILKYNVKRELVNDVNIQLCYDLLLIIAFIKIFRGKIESKQSDANLNGAIFYLRLRSFLDPFIYSFLEPEKANMISSIIVSNFELYEKNKFFDHYQTILLDYGFSRINVVDIKEFCNEINQKIFQSNMLNIDIKQKHDDYYNSGFLKIKSDNNLSLEQITNEVLPLEILEKNGVVLDETNLDVKNLIDSLKISKEVMEIFFPKKSEKEANLLKTVKFYNNEIPQKIKDEFLNYVNEIKYDKFDFSKFEMEEFGENIIKVLYVWNESSDRKEQMTVFRTRVEECILTKDLIITKYKTPEASSEAEEWNLEINI